MISLFPQHETLLTAILFAMTLFFTQFGISHAQAPSPMPAIPTNTQMSESGQDSKTWQARFEKLKTGGLTMVAILLLSIGALSFTLERIICLRIKYLTPERLIDRVRLLWAKGSFDILEKIHLEDESILALCVGAMAKHRRQPYNHIQNIVQDLATREIKKHMQRNYPLAVIATLSPLLGLLGTVYGMVGAFDTVATMGELGDPVLLAEDISKALVTTTAGLVVAIPTLGLFHFFKSKTSNYALKLEDVCDKLMHEWFLDLK